MSSITKAYEVLSDPQDRAAFESDSKKFEAIDSETISLDEDSYYNTVLQSDGPWLIQIYADWSYPCVLFKSHWERAAGSFEGLVQMGRIDLARHRILADNLMGGDIGLPFIIAVFQNKTVNLPAGSWMDQTKARAAMAGAVMRAVGEGRMRAPIDLPGCRKNRVKVTLVANKGSLARFYFHVLHPLFEEQCHFYGVGLLEPDAVAVVGAAPPAPVLLVEQPCGHSQQQVHQIKGPFRNSEQVRILLHKHCSPIPPYPTTLSAGSARSLCERGCLGSSDRDASSKLFDSAAQEGNAFTSVVYVDPSEHPAFSSHLHKPHDVFAMRLGSDSQEQLVVKDESISNEEFVAQLLDDEVLWESTGWKLQPIELDREAAAAAVLRNLKAMLSSPELLVVLILCGIVVLLWSILSVVQSGSIGRFPKALIKNVLCHWIKLHEQDLVPPLPRPKARMLEIPSTVIIPDDIRDVFECFKHSEDENAGLVADDILRIAKRCGVELDDAFAEEMIATAGGEQVNLARFFLITEQEVDQSDSESDSDDCCD